jgi:hypothetical protein
MTQEALEDNRGVEGWLRPEFKWASADDGPESIAGCQNADRVTGAVEDQKSPSRLLESRKELEPRTRVTSNDHTLQEHRRWSDPQPMVAVARAIDHILLFRF